MRIPMAAPQEYVNTYSTRRLGMRRKIEEIVSINHMDRLNLDLYEGFVCWRIEEIVSINHIDRLNLDLYKRFDCWRIE